MARQRKPKSEKVATLLALKRRPSVATIAKRAGCTPSYVYMIKNKKAA